MNNLIGMAVEMSMVVVIIAAMIGMVMWQNSRRRKVMASHNQMLDALRPGMRINVGGIIGRIKKIQEDNNGFRTILFQTGDEKNPSTMVVDARAVVAVMDDPTTVNDVTNHEEPHNRVEEPNDTPEPKEDAKKGKNTKK